MAAVSEGIEAGTALARRRGHEIVVRQILTSMRHGEPSLEVADLVLADPGEDVAGFDIAGAEDGFPPGRFLPAFVHLRMHGRVYTIHAGEAAGVDSIAGAVLACGANRIGHGVAITSDIGPDDTLGEGCRLRPRPADPVGAVSVRRTSRPGPLPPWPSTLSPDWTASVSPSPSTVTTS